MFALTNAAMFLHDRKMKKIVRRAQKAADEQLERADKCEQVQTKEEEGKDVKASGRSRADSTESIASSTFSEIDEQEVQIARSTAQVCPIDRFRQQYLHVAGYLRERDIHDPHPASDHVWIAASMVNRFGLYRPCISFRADYDEAVEAFEKVARREAREARRVSAMIATADEEEKARLQVLRDTPGHPVSYFSDAEFHSMVYGTKQGKSFVEAGEELVTPGTARLISVVRGYKAAQDIIAHSFDRGVSVYRGERLFKKSQRKMKHEMLRD